MNLMQKAEGQRGFSAGSESRVRLWLIFLCMVSGKRPKWAPSWGYLEENSHSLDNRKCHNDQLRWWQHDSPDTGSVFTRRGVQVSWKFCEKAPTLLRFYKQKKRKQILQSSGLMRTWTIPWSHIISLPNLARDKQNATWMTHQQAGLLCFISV
jgi:hypothetical protein